MSQNRIFTKKHGVRRTSRNAQSTHASYACNGEYGKSSHERGIMIYIPCLKTIPFIVAHTYITHIWQRKSRKRSGFVIYSYFKVSAFTAINTKGVLFVKVIRKEYLLSQMLRGQGLDLGAEHRRIKLCWVSPRVRWQPTKERKVSSIVSVVCIV